MRAELALISVFFVLSAAAQAPQAPPPRCTGPLSEDELTTLMKGKIPDAPIIREVGACGIDFEPTAEAIVRLRSAGASKSVLDAVRAATGPAERERQAEQTSWESIKDSLDPAYFEDYLRRYPQGQFAAIARESYQDAQIAAMRGQIEHALDARQWDVAEGQIQKLVRVAWEDDEIRGWQRRLANGREAERKQMEAEAALRAEQASWNSIQESPDPQAFEQFLREYPAGRYAEAARLKVAALTPGTVDYDEGARLGRAQEWRGAAEAFSRSIAQRSTSPVASVRLLAAASYLQRGSCYYRLGEDDRALQDFTSTIALQPELADAHLNRGLVLQRLKKWGDSVNDLSRAIELKPSAFAFGHRAQSYQALSQDQRAVADYTSAIGVDPDYELAYRERGILNVRLNDFAAAVQDLNRTIGNDPGDAEALKNRSIAKRQMGDIAAADNDKKKADGMERVWTLLRTPSVGASLQFFEKGETPLAAPVYRDRFSKSSRHIFLWLRLSYPNAKITERLDFVIRVVVTRPDGSNSVRYSPSYMSINWTGSNHTLDTDSRLSWLAGTYRVDLYTGNIHLASGNFEIVD